MYDGGRERCAERPEQNPQHYPAAVQHTVYADKHKPVLWLYLIPSPGLVDQSTPEVTAEKVEADPNSSSHFFVTLPASAHEGDLAIAKIPHVADEVKFLVPKLAPGARVVRVAGPAG